MSKAKFSIGDIIHHKRFNYRGVIFPAKRWTLPFKTDKHPLASW